jgi:UDP-N-acetylmuramate dehydrogenase
MPDVDPIPLSRLTTLRTGGAPERMIDAHTTDELVAALRDVWASGDEWLVLGGGSNLFVGDDPFEGTVVRVLTSGIERMPSPIPGRARIRVQAGHDWDAVVAYAVAEGLGGIEAMSGIPGTVGAAPVQNIGAYGIELKDRLESVDVVDLTTGRRVTLPAAVCGFGYRDSVFKQTGYGGLAGKSVITRVRLRCPKPWQPQLGYLDIERKMSETGIHAPDARQVFDWICEIRRAKLPDPARIGNAGSFFKNPVVSAEQCRDIITRDPHIVHYPMPDGSFKLAAGWLIDACGWKGKSVGGAAVYEKQALVLVNRGEARGAEVVTLARAIQESVYGRFGIRLEPEPVVV